MLVLSLAHDAFLTTLAGMDVEGAMFEVAGEAFALAPRPGDGAKLLEWNAACNDLGREAVVAVTSWERYGNARFGYWIDIPPGFSDVSEAGNGDGGIARSLDGTTELSVWGSHVTEGDFAAEVANRIELSSAYGWKITYQKKAEDWASWSGTKGGRVMYARAISLCRSRAAFFHLEYDLAEVATYDPVVERLVASLKSGDCN